jgi:outer membrane protein assembly factor BamB
MSRLLAFILISAVAQAQGVTSTWPQWRGPQRDGTVTTPLPTQWPEKLTKKWELTVGEGHSSPVVSGDRVVIHAREGDKEITRAVSLGTGKELWRNEFAAPYTPNPAARSHGPGPKSTPAIARGRVFTFGITGVLSALDLNTGKLVWRTPAPPAPPEYGTAMSPIAVDAGGGGVVIAHMGGKNKGALTAFDAATGKPRWQWTGDGPAYTSPVVAVIGGTRHVITQTQKFMVSVNAADGALLWQLPFTTEYDQTSVTPIVSGDLVIYSGLGNGVAAVRVARKGAQWVASPVWKNAEFSMFMSSPVISGKTLYGLANRNRGQFFAIDLATGKTLWTTQGRDGDNASVMTGGGLLLLSTTAGEFIVARANPAKFEEVRRYTVAESAMWAHPAVAPRVLLVKDVNKLICWSM